MATVYYITGGERSGKSTYAQDLALSLSSAPVYLATARRWDEDFEQRIERHIHDRDERWTTVEEEKFLSRVVKAGSTVVIDCVTLWLTNWYVDEKNDLQSSLAKAKKELDQLFATEATIIIISNEIGMGVHAGTHVGRKFVELQGWINQYIAKSADRAVLMVSGLPVDLK